MGDIIRWKFRDEAVDNPYAEVLDQCQYWDNVLCLPTQLNMEQSTIREIEEQEARVIEIIDRIIELGIEDYTNYLAEKWKNHWERNLTEETTRIWDEMFTKAQTVEETLDFVKDNDWDVEIEEWYLFWAIEAILEDYRIRVFEKLVRNENRFKTKN